jgi:hypothetical protein
MSGPDRGRTRSPRNYYSAPNFAWLVYLSAGVVGQRHDVPEEAVKAFQTEASRSGGDLLLKTISEWVLVEDY